jgi:hypothetical protein
MKGQSATILALNLALVQVHGESKFPSSTKQSHRKLIPYIDRTLLSFLDDSFFGRQTVINLLVEEYTNITAKAGCDKIDLLDSAIEAIDFCETDAEPVPITDYDFLFVGSVGEYLIFTCLFESHASHFRLPNSSPQHRCIKKPRQH